MRTPTIIATAAIIATTLTGCGGEPSAETIPADTAPIETVIEAAPATTAAPTPVTTAPEAPSTTSPRPDLLPLADRAEIAGVSLALAESWERKGVHITNTGAIYADDCAAARSVQVPATKRIMC